MKILITGANGLLGQKLVHLLSEKDEVAVVATAHGGNRLPSSLKGYQYLSMDILDSNRVISIVNDIQPDVIIHTAAMTNVDQCEEEKEACWELNVTAVDTLIQACKKTNSFLLHLSTDFIFDGQAGPYSETDTPSPISYYGESKLAAEQLLEKSTIDWAIVRTVLVYGIVHDMSRSNIILWVKNSLENKSPIRVVNDQCRTPTLAEDLAMGCWLIAQQRAKGIFNISGKDLLTPFEMAMKTADFFELDKSLITEVDASTFSQTAKRPPKTGFILGKAEKTLRYNPHSFDEGIAILASQIKELD